jgi:hypothetical protein
MVQGVTVQGAPYTVTGVAVTCLGQDGVVLKLARGVNGYLVLSLPRALHKMGLFTGSGPYAGRTVGPATVTVCLSAGASAVFAPLGRLASHGTRPA